MSEIVYLKVEEYKKMLALLERWVKILKDADITVHSTDSQHKLTVLHKHTKTLLKEAKDE